MNDPEVDAAFAEMTEGLTIGATDKALVEYDTMSNVNLSLLYNETRQRLLDRGELLSARTDLGRDLGAIYHGCLLAMQKRGMR